MVEKALTSRVIPDTERALLALYKSLLHIDAFMGDVERVEDFNYDYVVCAMEEISLRSKDDECVLGYSTAFMYSPDTVDELRKFAYHIDHGLEVIGLPWTVRDIQYLECRVQRASIRDRQSRYEEERTYLNLVAFIVGRMGIFDLSGARPRVYTNTLGQSVYKSLTDRCIEEELPDWAQQGGAGAPGSIGPPDWFWGGKKIWPKGKQS